MIKLIYLTLQYYKSTAYLSNRIRILYIYNNVKLIFLLIIDSRADEGKTNALYY